MKLLLFNPETEYALASGASFYTPPKRVDQLRVAGQLIPEAWAASEDIILVDDLKGLLSDHTLVTWSSLEQLFKDHPDLIIDPWGWNAALVRKLQDHGVPSSKLPSERNIMRIRELAHRRTTITLVSKWNELVDECDQTDVPVELTSIEDCMRFYRNNFGCWLKAPWSSSGRGIINTGADMTDELVEQWCRGILRRQGSVMGETAAYKKSDYATEWRLHEGNAYFLGLSSFTTSNRGKYISNEILSQTQMKERFDSESVLNLDTVVSLQEKILRNVIIGYDGLLGIDMIVERNGHLRPFIEMNLRRTMGMLHIIS